ncbi:MAG: FIG004453: protein YceG like, partial [uncultured Thermoleophilia bacterium]
AAARERRALRRRGRRRRPGRGGAPGDDARRGARREADDPRGLRDPRHRPGRPQGRHQPGGLPAGRGQGSTPAGLPGQGREGVDDGGLPLPGHVRAAEAGDRGRSRDPAGRRVPRPVRGARPALCPLEAAHPLRRAQDRLADRARGGRRRRPAEDRGRDLQPSGAGHDARHRRHDPVRDRGLAGADRPRAPGGHAVQHPSATGPAAHADREPGRQVAACGDEARPDGRPVLRGDPRRQAAPALLHRLLRRVHGLPAGESGPV